MKKIIALSLVLVMAFSLCACSVDAEAIDMLAEKTSKRFPMPNAVVVEKTEQRFDMWHVTFENEQYRVVLEMHNEDAAMFDVGHHFDCNIRYSLGNCLTDYTFSFEIAELDFSGIAIEVTEKP